MKQTTEQIIQKLRHPRTVKKQTGGQTPAAAAASKARADEHKMLFLCVGGAVAVLIMLTGLFLLNAQNRADNITASLSDEQLKGLSADAAFNPNTGVTYVQVQEGRDRNTSVSNLGSTIPVISRLNVHKFTGANYDIIGAAPWALTSNISSNLSDPELVRYLLGNDVLIKAFLARPDVAPLVTDPQALYELTKDADAMKEFFDGETVRAVLADEKMVQAIASSRLMSYLLISNAAKYFRARPQQAAQIIRQNPYLNELRQNEFVRRAVQENKYLKKIAPVLLK